MQLSSSATSLGQDGLCCPSVVEADLVESRASPRRWTNFSLRERISCSPYPQMPVPTSPGPAAPLRDGGVACAGRNRGRASCPRRLSARFAEQRTTRAKTSRAASVRQPVRGLLGASSARGPGATERQIARPGRVAVSAAPRPGSPQPRFSGVRGRLAHTARSDAVAGFGRHSSGLVARDEGRVSLIAGSLAGRSSYDAGGSRIVRRSYKSGSKISSPVERKR